MNSFDYSEDDWYINTFIFYIKGCTPPFDNTTINHAVITKGEGGKQTRNEIYNSALKGMNLAAGAGLLEFRHNYYYPTDAFNAVMIMGGDWMAYKQNYLQSINKPNLSNSYYRLGDFRDLLREALNDSKTEPAQNIPTSSQNSRWDRIYDTILKNLEIIVVALIIGGVLFFLGWN